MPKTSSTSVPSMPNALALGIEISSTSQATTAQSGRTPDYPAAYQAASFSSGFTIRNLTSALTSEFTGAALGCPGYKITAGDVATVPTTTALTRQIES
jgi:hypothetical protein